MKDLDKSGVQEGRDEPQGETPQKESREAYPVPIHYEEQHNPHNGSGGTHKVISPSEAATGGKNR